IAMRHVDRAPGVLGPITLHGLAWIAPVWRPLIARLASVVKVAWLAPVGAETAWFEGNLIRGAAPGDGKAPELVSCADPHHEAVEALRWVRELVSTGRAKPNEIALAAAAPEEWDEPFLALAAEAGLRIHFSHGVPALVTRDGQRCGALADVLLRGLGENRI